MNPQALSFFSGFDSFKQYDKKSASLTVSGTVASFSTFSGSVIIGRANSVTQIYYSTDVSSDFHAPGQKHLLMAGAFILHADGSIAADPGNPVYTYDIQLTASYTSTTVGLVASVQNPYASDLTPITETLSFTVYTFVGPFD